MAKPKILIADDAEINRSMLADILNGSYEILEADNGKQAWDIIRQPDGQLAAVLLDLIMPGMDGLDVLEAMKAEGLTAHIPVLVLATDHLHDRVHEAYELGAADCILHPFDGPTVRRRVGNLAALYGGRSQAEGNPCPGGAEEKAFAVSDRTIRLMEYERTKHQLFAAMSREAQFEYIADSDTLLVSEWGAKYVDVEEVLAAPKENPVLSRVLGEGTVEDLAKLLRSTTPEQPVVEYSCIVRLRGERRWGKIIARAMWSDGEHPRYQGAIGKYMDVHKERSRLATLEKLAAHDGLTGLLNRKAAKDQIERLLQDQDRTFALAVIDLDYFKQANDHYGHLFGDKVLVHLANRLRTSIRGTDMAARVGGDEFLMFLEYGPNDRIEKAVDRIFRALSGEFEGFRISVSVGVAQSATGDGTYDDLFRRADQALYAAKEKGRNCYCFYDDSMKTTLSMLSPIESDSQ